MEVLKVWFAEFEKWFNANLGWFFVNGNKVNHFDPIDLND